MTDKDIINKVSKYKFIKYKLFENKIFSEEEKCYVINRYSDTNIFKVNLYRIINNIEELHRCPICGNKCDIRYDNRSVYGYNNTCSSECHYKLCNKKGRETLFERYGVYSSVATPQGNLKMRQSWANHTKEENENLVNKRRKTCLERYGVDNKAKLPETIEKMFETNIKRYGHKCSAQGEEQQKKAIETSLKLYGVDYPMKSKIVSNKIIETKKKHHTLNTSKQEQEIFNKLLSKFPDVIHQYKDKEKYPFNCDFYIPSKDLWIEYQGHWSHGKAKWENTDDQIKLLNNWREKSKTSKYMETAIYVWTDLDVRKRTIAKENNLNYLEFFNMKEFDEWFNRI